MFFTLEDYKQLRDVLFADLSNSKSFSISSYIVNCSLSEYRNKIDTMLTKLIGERSSGSIYYYHNRVRAEKGIIIATIIKDFESNMKVGVLESKNIEDYYDLLFESSDEYRNNMLSLKYRKVLDGSHLTYINNKEKVAADKSIIM